MASQVRYGSVIVIFLALGLGGAYFARKIDQRNARDTEILRAIRRTIPLCSFAPAPDDWRRVSLGPVSLCLPPASAISAVGKHRDDVLLERGMMKIIITAATTEIGKQHLIRFAARQISFPRDWDEVDARGVIHTYPHEPSDSLSEASSKALRGLKEILSPKGLQTVETFTIESGIKGLILTIGDVIEVEYWSKDEQTRGVFQILPNTAENRMVAIQMLSTMRVESEPVATSRPDESLVDQCRRLLLTTRPG